MCKLNKAIYGLKQAARCWHNHLTAILDQINLKQLMADSCIFVNEDKSIIVAVYVDDLLILCKRDKDYSKIRDSLAANFEITDKGQVKQFFGMQIAQTDEEITISQAPFISELLQRFNMADCKSVTTPIPTGTIFDVTEDDDDCEDVPLFQSIVGSLIYLSNGSRPDVQFGVNKLCKYMSSPKQKHLLLAKRILRYLQGTKDARLTYTNSKTGNESIEIYCDADFANDLAKSNTQDLQKSVTFRAVFEQIKIFLSFMARSMPATVSISRCRATASHSNNKCKGVSLPSFLHRGQRSRWFKKSPLAKRNWAVKMCVHPSATTHGTWRPINVLKFSGRLT